MKHIQNPSKYSKCLNMVEQILNESIKFFSSKTLMNIYFIIMSVKDKSWSEEDCQWLQRLYELLCEYVLENEDNFEER